MKILVQTKQLLSSSSDILSLSRNIRQAGNVVDDIEKNLRQLSELDRCRHELRGQKESIELLTARLVNLSTALCEISKMYNHTEQESEYLLEERAPSRYSGVTGNLYNGTDIHNSVQNILKK